MSHYPPPQHKRAPKQVTIPMYTLNNVKETSTHRGSLPWEINHQPGTQPHTTNPQKLYVPIIFITKSVCKNTSKIWTLKLQNCQKWLHYCKLECHNQISHKQCSKFVYTILLWSRGSTSLLRTVREAILTCHAGVAWRDRDGSRKDWSTSRAPQAHSGHIVSRASNSAPWCHEIGRVGRKRLPGVNCSHDLRRRPV